ncbi:MAG: GNAT family protein [Alphaproteobacteria bacterium]|nr:GNAT family protein [Alphaproteobacteria bacterium]
MASERERGSAAGRRRIGNAEVGQGHWDGFEGSVLTGPGIIVEPVDPDRDTTVLYVAAIAGEESDRIWDYLGYGPFRDADAMHEWLCDCAASKDPLFMVYRDRGTGQLGGMGSFMEIRPAAGVGEIGNIWFCRAWQRDRRATEALSMMMHHVLETRGYRRLEWKCNALNAPSRSAALRLGFRYEGTFLNHMIVKGRSRDTAWFSLTAEEWPAVRDAHTRWLAPENFAADGQQKVSLSELTRALW